MVNTPLKQPYTARLGRIVVVLFASTALLSGVVSLGLLAIPYASWRGYLDSISGDGSADVFTRSIYLQLLATFAVVGILLLCVGFGVYGIRERATKYATSLVQSILSDFALSWRWIGGHLSVLPALVASVALAVILPWSYLDEPIRYDEAHTYVNYARPQLFMAMTRYDAPNNHVLHSVLCHLSLRIFGDSLGSLRLPTFAAGVLCVALTTLWVTLMTRPSVGFLAGSLLAASPTAVEHLTNARGYTLTAFLFISSAWAAWLYHRHRSTTAWILWVFSSAFSIYAVPTMLYGTWSVFVWLIMVGRIRAVHGNQLETAIAPQRIWSPLLGFAAIGAVTFFCYLPIFATNDLQELRALFTGSKLRWLEISQRLPFLIVSSFQWMVWEIPAWISLAMLAGVVASWTCASSPLRLEMRYGMLAASSILLPIFFQQMLPPERAWYFLYPLFLAISAIGLDSMVGRWLKGNWPTIISIFMGFSFAIWSYWHLQQTQVLHNTPRQCTFREVEPIAVYLHEQAQPREPIILVTPSSAPIIYEFQRRHWSSDHFLVPGKGLTQDRTAWLVTSQDFQQTPKSVLKELELEDLFRHHQVTEYRSFSTATIYRLELTAP